MMEMQAAAGRRYQEALGVLGTALARDYQNAETHNLLGFLACAQKVAIRTAPRR